MPRRIYLWSNLESRWAEGLGWDGEGWLVLCVVSLGKKINSQDEKARMPVAPRAEGKEAGCGCRGKEPGAGRLCSELHFVCHLPSPPSFGTRSGR